MITYHTILDIFEGHSLSVRPEEVLYKEKDLSTSQDVTGLYINEYISSTEYFVNRLPLSGLIPSSIFPMHEMCSFFG